MIAFVRGHFAIKNPANVVVDVNGVGYDVQISLNTYSAISEKESGQLFTYLHITENGQTLYGFADVREKELFLQLISVSGVGAATARVMLSGMKPDEIVKAIVQGNAQLLTSIKGIGKKTAELLVVSLRDKFSKEVIETGLIGTTAILPHHDAIDALVALGIAKPVAEKAVQKVIQVNSDIALEQIIKLALKNL
jgi:Holliday junction DNA helicase RuvA